MLNPVCLQSDIPVFHMKAKNYQSAGFFHLLQVFFQASSQMDLMHVIPFSLTLLGLVPKIPLLYIHYISLRASYI